MSRKTIANYELALRRVLLPWMGRQGIGTLDRLTWYGVRARYPQEAERRAYLGKFWYRPPGGESWADVALRVRHVLRDLRADYDDERLLVVSHDVPILLMHYVVESLTPRDAVALSGKVASIWISGIISAAVVQP